MSWPNSRAALQTFLLRRTPTVLVTANSNCSCYGELYCSCYGELYCSCYGEQRFSCLRRTQRFFVASNSECSTQLHVYDPASAGPFIFADFLREKSLQWLSHQCILREEFGYFVLCTLFKNVTVSCNKSLHYSVDSVLCITIE